RILLSEKFPQMLTFGGLAYSVVALVFPLPLHKERVPEVMAFKETIVGSQIPGPVWLVHSSRDHNQVGTSGEWYFHRLVFKVEDEPKWERELKLRAAQGLSSWIITDEPFFRECRLSWCTSSRLVQAAHGTALVLHK